MRLVLTIAFISILFSGNLYAQKGRKKPVSFQKHYNEILPKAPQYKMSGWFFAPGATYMMTPFIYQNRTFDETSTQKFDARARGLGRPGIYAEVGSYKMLPYWKFFKFMDYGVSYKGLRGNEKANGQYVSLPSETPIPTLEETEGTFGFHYAEAFVNFNHIWRISKYNFIQHSLGANAGYAFMANQGGTSLSPVGYENPGRIAAQLHYKLGFGIKMRGDWLIIPALETPILNAWPFESGRSSYGFFSSRYRPIIFSIRIMLMRPANTLDCTPVRTREGWKMPTDMDKQDQMDGVK
ncbi:hypothetical protein N9P66_00680 [Salibacteraceae bacterium]|nr:hypothetical protein [Salibacteraceae bacterium]